MALQKIEHKYLYKDVISQLEAYIVENDLQIGDRLPTERELALQLGISRGTVREAFRILEENQILESRPGGGRFLSNSLLENQERNRMISAIEGSDLLDLLDLRTLIEQKAVELVIDNASDQALEDVHSALHKSNDVFTNDSAFHLALAKASNNSAFYNVLRYNLSLLAKTRRASLKTSGRKEQMSREHNIILERIMARDKEGAAEALRQHLEGIRLSISSQIKRE